MSAEHDLGEAQRRRIESPCIGVCTIDEATGLCEGCLRTLEEVAAWGSSTAAERRAILAALTRRRDGLDDPRHGLFTAATPRGHKDSHRPDIG